MALGILLAVLTGFSWVVTGAVVGLVERHGRPTGQLLAARSSFLFAAAILLIALGRMFWPEAAMFQLCLEWRPALLMAAWGALSYVMAVFMGRAMARGPNGAAWTIVQSGFVFPFAMGIALGNTEATATRMAGIALVLAGVVFGGMARATAHRAAARSESTLDGDTGSESTLDGATRSESARDGAARSESTLDGAARSESTLDGAARSESARDGAAGSESTRDGAVESGSSGEGRRGGCGWLVPALLGFVFCGANQCAVNLVSYLPPEARPAQPERIAWGALGMFAAAMVHGASVATRGTTAPRSTTSQAPLSFLIKVAAFESAIWLFAGLLLLYNSLDLLQAAGRVAIASPIMVAACLAGFLVYGAVALRERPGPYQTLGILCSLGGIALLAA